MEDIIFNSAVEVDKKSLFESGVNHVFYPVYHTLFTNCLDKMVINLCDDLQDKAIFQFTVQIKKIGQSND